MNHKFRSQIRVFLSSTFADMQSERNALVKLFRILCYEALINSLGPGAIEELGIENWGIAHGHYQRAILYK